VKRKDFNATLKQLTDCSERTCSGNRFHSDGAATANERAPNFVAVLGMTRSSRAADQCTIGGSRSHSSFAVGPHPAALPSSRWRRRCHLASDT